MRRAPRINSPNCPASRKSSRTSESFPTCWADSVSLTFPRGSLNLAIVTRAYVKIQDGCLLRCSYCIIPHVRPKMHSRPVEHILDEVQRLVANNYREIVLTGIHLGHFGVDWNVGLPKSRWIRLSDLLHKIMLLPGDFRVRLSSIEATEVTRELIQNHPTARRTEFAHICTSASKVARTPCCGGCDGRWGIQTIGRSLSPDSAVVGPARFDDRYDRGNFLGKRMPSSKRHARSLDRSGFPRSMFFRSVHVKAHPPPRCLIRFSATEKSARGKRLAQIESECRAAYFRRLVGRRLQMLVESHARHDRSLLMGTACRYAPIQLSCDHRPTRAARRRAGQFVVTPVGNCGGRRPPIRQKL